MTDDDEIVGAMAEAIAAEGENDDSSDYYRRLARAALRVYRERMVVL